MAGKAYGFENIYKNAPTLALLFWVSAGLQILSDVLNFHVANLIINLIVIGISYVLYGLILNKQPAEFNHCRLGAEGVVGLVGTHARPD